jgi:alpha-tubulin suppressor-like RCC1 family protein
MVSTGGRHTALLRSDGCAVACGLNNDGQCSLPALGERVVYNQISAGANGSKITSKNL